MNDPANELLLGIISTGATNMFGIFKGRVETLVADKGLVRCPGRGVDTDIDVCYECPQVRAILQEQDATLVRCVPEQTIQDGWTYRTWSLRE
jgi:hypothetical protein